MTQWSSPKEDRDSLEDCRGSDDVVGSHWKFARRFAEGIGKLAGNAKGDRRKEDQRTYRKIAGGYWSMWECWAGVKFEHRAEVRMTHWELVKSSPEVDRGLDDVVGSSSRTHQKFAGKFIGSSPIGCQELTRCSPEERWKFVGSSPNEIGSSPGVHRKDAGSSPKR
ncbi:hypothetical protein BHE74_00007679 [Ensete ventricosum]|nr:hypothetical protein BHE74_00007679 [Ensete ventricosum]